MKAFILMGIFLWISNAVFALPLSGFTDLEDKELKLSPKKNAALVVFWATWCPDCKKKLSNELPKLQKKGQVEILTINTDRSAKRAKHYIKKPM